MRRSMFSKLGQTREGSKIESLNQTNQVVLKLRPHVASIYYVVKFDVDAQLLHLFPFEYVTRKMHLSIGN